MKHKICKDFLWGSATAAYQCEGAAFEGGRGPSQWDTFLHSDQNVSGITGDVSCDNYHHFKEDLKLMREGGQNTYRLSIAWSRILPDESGKPNEEGIKFYNDLFDECKKIGIEPLVTLFHYDIPEYLAKKGGFENREMAYEFEKYARVCFEAFHDKVNLWITVNEPAYYTYCGYLAADYPPFVADFQRYVVASYHVILGSALAVNAFREMGYKGQIGVDQDSCRAETPFTDPENLAALRKADLFYNRWVLDTSILGHFPEDLAPLLQEKGIDLSFVQPGDKEIFAKGKVDLLAQNVYTRKNVQVNKDGVTQFKVNRQGKNSKVKEGTSIGGWFETIVDPTVERNQWGREIYPKCMYDTLVDLKRDYGDIPIYIAENGHGMYETPDENGYVADDERIGILKRFIDYMVQAIDEGVNVKGYYVWSSMDLYSWINGYQKRYGLIRVDYDTPDLKRIPKKSYYWYRDYIKKLMEESSEFSE